MWRVAEKDFPRNISIHAPHEGERHSCIVAPKPWVTFQSTLPTRGSDFEVMCLPPLECISIHAPHEGERRAHHRREVEGRANFNPRSPRGGATPRRCHTAPRYIFQSTLPTRGSDADRRKDKLRGQKDFNPRSPRGGATFNAAISAFSRSISIHAPHEGERLCRPPRPWRYGKYFNPRSPRGGATN